MTSKVAYLSGTEAGLSAGLQEAMNTSSHKRAVAGRKTGQ